MGVVKQLTFAFVSVIINHYAVHRSVRAIKMGYPAGWTGPVSLPPSALTSCRGHWGSLEAGLGIDSATTHQKEKRVLLPRNHIPTPRGEVLTAICQARRKGPHACECFYCCRAAGGHFPWLMDERWRSDGAIRDGGTHLGAIIHKGPLLVAITA